jgi:hypothetical protein
VPDLDYRSSQATETGSVARESAALRSTSNSFDTTRLDGVTPERVSSKPPFAQTVIRVLTGSTRLMTSKISSYIASHRVAFTHVQLAATQHHLSRETGPCWDHIQPPRTNTSASPLRQLRSTSCAWISQGTDPQAAQEPAKACHNLEKSTSHLDSLYTVPCGR